MVSLWCCDLSQVVTQHPGVILSSHVNLVIMSSPLVTPPRNSRRQFVEFCSCWWQVLAERFVDNFSGCGFDRKHWDQLRWETGRTVSTRVAPLCCTGATNYEPESLNKSEGWAWESRPSFTHPLGAGLTLTKRENKKDQGDDYNWL